MRRKGLILIPVLVAFISIPQASSQPSWDLSILRVTLFPPGAEVQQGQSLLITIYIGNNEPAQFSGTVTVSLYVDGSLASKENWQIGNVSAGSVPIPSGGYRTVVTSLNTSKLTLGVHELTIEIVPKDYADPRPGDNRYSLNFVVVPPVNPFIEVEGEPVQLRECEVTVHVPNPRSEPLERLRVRLFVNGSEVGSKEVYVPPKSISAAKFYYKPESPGALRIEALLLKDDQLMNKASMSVTVRPSCDLGVEVRLSERVFAGEPISGRLRVYNEGPSQTKANLTLMLDGNVLETKAVGFIDARSEIELDLALGMRRLEIGSHVVTVKIDPVDAVDLDLADNEFSVSFRAMPIPVSVSARVSSGNVYVNLTNLAEVTANIELSLVRNGSEVRRINLTLKAGSSEPIEIRGLEPGNYKILVYSHGAAVASAEVSLERGFKPEEVSPLWSIAAIPIAGAVAYYLVYLRRRRKKWPS